MKCPDCKKTGLKKNGINRHRWAAHQIRVNPPKPKAPPAAKAVETNGPFSDVTAKLKEQISFHRIRAARLDEALKLIEEEA